jgi:hypothetical protein
VRVWQQTLDGGIEIGRNLVRLDAAPGQHTRQQFRHAVPLGNRQRARSPPLIQPIAPGASGRGFLHAKKCARQ